MKETIVVWFSCGAASAVAAKKTLEQYGDTCNVRVVNNPVIEEDHDNQRFLKDVEQWIGQDIEICFNHKYPSCSAVSVWDARKFMSGVHGAPCTLELKKHARYQFEADNDIDWHVLGFTAGEENRFCNFQQNERQNALPVLIEHNLTKADCFQILMDAGIDLPQAYKNGMLNANCIGCPKATSPTYWNLIRKAYPETFEVRARQSRVLGAKLVRVKGKRIFLDELKTTDTGRPLKDLDFECGVFCKTGTE